MGWFDNIDIKKVGAAVVNPLTLGTAIGANDLTSGRVPFSSTPGTSGPRGVTLSGTPEYQENRNVTDLRSQLGQMKAPQKLSAESVGPKADALTSLPEYEKLRANIKSEAQQQGQQASEAMQRRFASLGQANSGASIKAEQLAQADINKQAENQMNQLGFQEAQALRQQQNIQEERQFQKEQAAAGRNFQREIYNADTEFKDKVFKFDSATKLGQLDLAYDQNKLARAAQDNQRLIDQYNLELSGMVASKKKPGILGSLVGENGNFF